MTALLALLLLALAGAATLNLWLPTFAIAWLTLDVALLALLNRWRTRSQSTREGPRDLFIGWIDETGVHGEWQLKETE